MDGKGKADCVQILRTVDNIGNLDMGHLVLSWCMNGIAKRTL